jgi:hypothetical protein
LRRRATRARLIAAPAMAARPPPLRWRPGPRESALAGPRSRDHSAPIGRLHLRTRRQRATIAGSRGSKRRNAAGWLKTRPMVTCTSQDRRGAEASARPATVNIGPRDPYRAHAGQEGARELLPGLRSGRSTLGRESGDRPVHTKPRVRERSGSLVLTRVFARVYRCGWNRSTRERARFWVTPAPAGRSGRPFGPRDLGFSR